MFSWVDRRIAYCRQHKESITHVAVYTLLSTGVIYLFISASLYGYAQHADNEVILQIASIIGIVTLVIAVCACLFLVMSRCMFSV